MKTISDAKVGEYILSCLKETLMPSPRCAECKRLLLEEEIWERKQNGLDLYGDDVLCDTCWFKWLKDRGEERRHPDDV